MQDENNEAIEAFLHSVSFEESVSTNSPERNLYVAVIGRAIQDWLGKDINLAEAAKEWFCESIVEENPEVMTFQYVCDSLDLNCSKFRSAIISYVTKLLRLRDLQKL